jgi:TolB-like protein/DNA-binding winged helix-turn-helix (wHTH) protein
MPEANPEPQEGRFRVLDLVVDLRRQAVSRNGVRIELPDLSFKLLAALVRCAPHTLDKDELIRQVWGSVVVSDETLSQRVRLLRQALGEDGQEPRYLSSVRGRGYRLLCDAAPVTVPDTQSSRAGAAAKRSWLPIAAGTVLLVIAGWWLFQGDPGTAGPAAEPAIRSIAVLPFADLSPNQNHGYFADGMQEELLSRLAGHSNLQVVSRTSVERFRNTSMRLPEIAGELGVDAVIESSVRVADDRVRITVQLIDAGSDRHLWADAYDRTLSVANLFAIQQEVAEQVSRALALQYPDEGQAVALPTSNLAAYDAYLLGRYNTVQQTTESLQTAISQLQRAVSLDPEFAEAWSALGWAWSFLGTLYGGLPPREVYPQAKAAATRALAIDNSLADARSLYADILTWYDWDFAAAEREYQKTLELDPLNVLGYALFLSVQQRHAEAITLIETLIAAAPDDAWVRINAGWTFLRAGQYQRAIAEAELAPLHVDSRPILGFAYLALDDPDGAMVEFEASLRERGRGPRQLANLARGCFETGQPDRGRAVLEELEAVATQRYVPADLLADIYFSAGDAERGFAAYLQAVEDRARGVIFLATNSSLDNYREDPRYAALLEAVGLSTQ